MNDRRHDGAADSFASDQAPWPLPPWIWWLINALQLVFTLVWSAVGISLALLVRLLFANERIPLRMAAWMWAPVLVRGAGARLEVSGLDRVDRSTAQMFVANHQSMIDICALFMAVPVPLRFMLKASLGRVPFLGWYTRAMGMILLRRGQTSAIAAQLERACGLLQDGHSLAAFPEGTRSRDGSLRPFKSGSFRTAIRAGVPVVPVAIAGSGRVMPADGFRIRPGRIRLAFGQPIPTDGLTMAEHHELARQARAAVAELMRRID